MERMEALKNDYTTHNEDTRLTPKHGMVEFLTTVCYEELVTANGFAHTETKKFDHLPFTSGCPERSV